MLKGMLVVLGIEAFHASAGTCFDTSLPGTFSLGESRKSFHPSSWYGSGLGSGLSAVKLGQAVIGVGMLSFEGSLGGKAATSVATARSTNGLRSWNDGDLGAFG